MMDKAIKVTPNFEMSFKGAVEKEIMPSIE